MQRKIAVEEHYALPPVKAAGNNAFREDYLADVQRRLSNREARIEEMDANGIEYTPVSLTEPGIQGIPNPREAVDMAKRCNDHVYEYYMLAYPKRFGGLASIALQNPKAAAAELERSVKQLGFVGCMINGFTDMADSSNLFISTPNSACRSGKWSRNWIFPCFYIHAYRISASVWRSKTTKAFGGRHGASAAKPPNTLSA